MSELLRILLTILAVIAAATIQGDANQAARSHGPDYLAMRLPRGTVVTICGAGDCWERARVTDYGPKVSTGDIADIALDHWLDVCALPAYRGECQVRVTIHDGGRPRPTGPPTDTAP